MYLDVTECLMIHMWHTERVAVVIPRTSGYQMGGRCNHRHSCDVANTIADMYLEA